MRICGCTVAPATSGDERFTVLEKASHYGPSNSKTAMRVPIRGLADPQLRTKFCPNECFWCKGLRWPTGGRGEFEDLCWIILSALVSLFALYYHSRPRRWYPPRSAAQPQGLALGKGSVPGDVGYSHDILAQSALHHLCFLSLDEKGLYTLTWLGGKQKLQEVVYIAVARVDLYAKMHRPKLPECRVYITDVASSFLTLCSYYVAALEAYPCPHWHTHFSFSLAPLATHSVADTASHLLNIHALLFPDWQIPSWCREAMDLIRHIPWCSRWSWFPVRVKQSLLSGTFRKAILFLINGANGSPSLFALPPSFCLEHRGQAAACNCEDENHKPKLERQGTGRSLSPWKLPLQLASSRSNSSTGLPAFGVLLAWEEGFHCTQLNVIQTDITS